jgi:hypothetical protein
MIISWLLSRIKNEDSKETIVVGLAGGLAIGLAAGLADGLFPFDVLFVLAVLVIVEILYWFDKKQKPVKVSKWRFVAERKLEAGVEVGLGLGIVAYAKVVQDNWKAISDTLGTMGYYAFMFLGVVGVIGIWLWFNGLKYRDVNIKKKRIRS